MLKLTCRCIYLHKNKYAQLQYLLALYLPLQDNLDLLSAHVLSRWTQSLSSVFVPPTDRIAGYRLHFAPKELCSESF